MIKLGYPVYIFLSIKDLFLVYSVHLFNKVIVYHLFRDTGVMIVFTHTVAVSVL